MSLDTIVTGSKLTAIANAIRTKGDTQAQLTLDQMPQAIAALPSGGGGTSPFLEQVLKNPSNSNNDPHDIDLDLAAWGDSPYNNGAYVRDYAFYNSSVNLGIPARRLGNVTIPAWIYGIGAYAFYSAGVTSIEFAAGTTSQLAINSHAFEDQQSLLSVAGPRPLYFNGTSVFGSCTNLATVDITLTPWSSIPSDAFTSCTGLTRAILRCAEHMYGISSAAFSGCLNLAELVIDDRGGSPYMLVSLASDALSSVPETCRIYVPDALVDAYKAATNWSTRADYIFPLSTFVEE